MGTPVCTDGHRYRFKTKHQPLFYLPRLSVRHFFLAIIFLILTLILANVYISTTPLFLRRFAIQVLNRSEIPNIDRYVILPSEPCRGRDVELVICVTGGRGNARIRNTIRETWGSYSQTGIGGKMIEIGVESRNKLGNKDEEKNERDRKKRIIFKNDGISNVFNKTYNVVLLFFIGSAPSSDLLGRSHQIRIQTEFQTFGDIVQGDFEDTTRNLSLKSVSVLKWVSNYCPDTKYILKVDDDMYVNIPLLLQSLHVRTKLLQNKSSSITLSKSSVLSSPPSTHTTNSTSSTDHHLVPPSDFIVGFIHHHAQPYRDNSSKWYTPADVYNNSHYPDFTSGTAYAMTVGAAKRLYKASVLLQRTFWLEDVYITGICAKEAGVNVYSDYRFNYQKPQLSGCYFRRHLSGHRLTAKEIQKVHKDVLSKNLKCPGQEPPY